MAEPTKERRLFAAGVIQRRSERDYVPMRDRTWDADAEVFAERPIAPEAA